MRPLGPSAMGNNSVIIIDSSPSPPPSPRRKARDSSPLVVQRAEARPRNRFQRRAAPSLPDEIMELIFDLSAPWTTDSLKKVCLINRRWLTFARRRLSFFFDIKSHPAPAPGIYAHHPPGYGIEAPQPPKGCDDKSVYLLTALEDAPRLGHIATKIHLDLPNLDHSARMEVLGVIMANTSALELKLQRLGGAGSALNTAKARKALANVRQLEVGEQCWSPTTDGLHALKNLQYLLFSRTEDLDVALRAQLAAAEKDDSILLLPNFLLRALCLPNGALSKPVFDHLLHSSHRSLRSLTFLPPPSLNLSPFKNLTSVTIPYSEPTRREGNKLVKDPVACLGKALAIVQAISTLPALEHLTLGQTGHYELWSADLCDGIMWEDRAFLLSSLPPSVLHLDFSTLFLPYENLTAYLSNPDSTPHLISIQLGAHARGPTGQPDHPDEAEEMKELEQIARGREKPVQVVWKEELPAAQRLVRKSEEERNAGIVPPPVAWGLPPPVPAGGGGVAGAAAQILAQLAGMNARLQAAMAHQAQAQARQLARAQARAQAQAARRGRTTGGRGRGRGV